jgi:hypothetical protein
MLFLTNLQVIISNSLFIDITEHVSINNTLKPDIALDAAANRILTKK